MNRRPFRLWLKRWKALWLAFAATNCLVVSSMLLRLDNAWAHGVVTVVVEIAWVYFLSRAFRALPEDFRPQRAWWRVTARPTAGFVLGGLFGLEAALRAAALATGGPAAANLPVAIGFGALAALYLHSSVRLLSAPRVAGASSGA